jgi:hypothetical protein
MRSLLLDPQTRTFKDLAEPMSAVETYLSEPMAVVDNRISQWMSNLPSTYEQADTVGIKHARFFPFEPIATCRQEEAVGGAAKSDKSKLMCGLENLQTPGCVIYSIGGDNNWDFERDLLLKTKCEIHTFDCTGPKERFDRQPTDARSHFHHICIGHVAAPAHECSHDHALCGESMTLDQMQTMLGHTAVDVLKIDVEGWEVPILRSWAANTSTKLPRQLLMELHWRSQFLEVPMPDSRAPKENLLEVLTPRETVDLCRMLIGMGYVTAERDDNISCDHCSELTLINVKEFSLVPWAAMK